MNNVTTLSDKRAGVAPRTVLVRKSPRIYLVGIMRALGPNDENILPKAKKTQAVLAYLCLAQGERLLRNRIAGIVWDRSGEAQARDSLRHALGEIARSGHWHLEMDHDTVQLDISGCWIDVFAGPDQPELLLDSLYGISTSFDQWLMAERFRLEEHWRNMLEKELGDLVAQSEPAELRAAAARKLLNVVPTNEVAVRSLMLAFAELDEPAQAIREYERFRAVIDVSLGLPPSKTTTALYEMIRTDARIRAARPIKRAPPIEPDPEPTEVSARRGKAAVPAMAAASAVPAEPWAPWASVAVLPFRNLTGASEGNLISEGLLEDLVEVLSRVPNLFVISRLSSTAFQAQQKTSIEIGEALGVRYVLSGSVRVIGSRLRLIAELAETENGKALWVSKYDETLGDVIAVQTRLSEAIVQSVAPHLRSAEISKAMIKRPEDQSAYELFLRAQECMHYPARAMFEKAEHLFHEAIERQPNFAAALAWRAHWHVVRVGQGWSPDPARDARDADHFAARAVECDAAEHIAIAVQGHVAAYFRKDFDVALTCFDRALRINQNGARAWLWSAFTHAWLGNGANAVDAINRALALSPYDPLMCVYSGGASLAYLSDGQYARAIEFALRSIGENRAYTSAYKGLILALVFSGREDEARGRANQLRVLEPGFNLRQFRARSPACTGELGERYCEAFERVGIPLSA